MTSEDHAYVLIGVVLLSVFLASIGALSWAVKRLAELLRERQEDLS